MAVCVWSGELSDGCERHLLKAGYPTVLTSVPPARKDRKRKAGNEGLYKRGEGIDRMT